MKKSVKSLFNENILLKIEKKYGILKSNIRYLGGFENIVYEFRKNGNFFILRVTHSSHRSKSQIRAELDWINFLSVNGCSVSNPIRFKGTDFIETIPSVNSNFYIVIFEKLDGKLIKNHEWQSDLNKKLGQITGELHFLSKKYRPQDNINKRPAWHEEDFINIERYIPKSQPKVLEKFRELIGTLKELMRNKNNYGLIHSDLHSENLLFKDGKFSIFDFDDSIYFWYIYDVAKISFNIFNNNYQNVNRLETIKLFFEDFFSGYCEYNDMPMSWQLHLALLLKFRVMELYTIIHRSYNLNELPTFEKKFMENRKKFIENDVPFIDIDFTKLTI